MLIRDVIEAVAKAAEVRTLDLTGPETTHRLARLRHLGFLVSARITGRSWSVIARTWGRGRGEAAERGARKAEARLLDCDPEAVEFLRLILGHLKLSELPAHPETATYRTPIETIDQRISLVRARLARLERQRAVEVRRMQTSVQEARA